MELVSVTVPPASVSKEELKKNNQKCWAKWITRFDYSVNGVHAYEGVLLPVGRKVNLPVNSVVLHVDESSDIGIGLVDETGEIAWEAVTSGFDAELREAAFRLFRYIDNA